MLDHQVVSVRLSGYRHADRTRSRTKAPARDQSTYYVEMNIDRCQMRRWAVGLTLASLPLIGVALAPTSVADSFDCIGSVSLSCMMNSGGGLAGVGNPPIAQGFQPGDLVIPASGGLPVVAVAPSMGGLVVTTDGVVVAANPPPVGPIGGSGDMGFGGMGA